MYMYNAILYRDILIATTFCQYFIPRRKLHLPAHTNTGVFFIVLLIPYIDIPIK